MEVEVHMLRKLLLALSEKTRLPQDFSGFGLMSDLIGKGDHQKYLYEKHQKIKASKDDHARIKMQDGKVDRYAQFLGYKHMRDFIQQVDAPMDPTLESLVGNYYSYVRRNDEEGIVLRSPVRIYKIENKIMFELQGPSLHYQGEVRLRHGALYILMQAPSGKEFHHVYKIGIGKRPEVLQGIFSGVSSTFEPLGGRAVLARKTETEGLEPRSMSVKSLLASESLIDKAIGSYFENYHDNNLKIKRVVSFTMEDL